MDAFLSSIDNFVSLGGGNVKGFSRAFSQAHLHRIFEFVAHTTALGRAYDLELISYQRVVDILFPPYIKLAHAFVTASRHEMPEGHFWFTKLWDMCQQWFNLVDWTLSGQAYADNLDKEDVLKPVIGPKRRAELVYAILETTFLEVRRLVVNFYGKGLGLVVIRGKLRSSDRVL